MALLGHSHFIIDRRQRIGLTILAEIKQMAYLGYRPLQSVSNETLANVQKNNTEKPIVSTVRFINLLLLSGSQDERCDKGIGREIFMLEKVKNAKERWGGVSEIIDRWLQDRQDMLVQYCALSAVVTFDENNEEQCEQLRQLCQIMMDYTSAGHFEIYGKLVREAKDFNDHNALEEADSLYVRVEKTTDSILDFNDKYQETDDFSSLTKDLSLIGERLASRFEAEDRMIAVLHESHRELVA